MSEALLELLSESWGDLATKKDLAEVKADLKAEINALEKETKSNLREFEWRMRLHLYAVEFW